MKICVTGDIHGNLKEIKKIKKLNPDLILVTGDSGKADLARKKVFGKMTQKEILKERKFEKALYMEIFSSTLKVLKYLSKIAKTYAIMGNVGRRMTSELEVKEYKEEFNLNVPSLKKELNKIKQFNLVKNGVRNIQGIRIGFLEYFVDSCWYEEYKENEPEGKKEAKKETKKAKDVLKNFKNLDILICHQPPYGYLDKTKSKFIPKEWNGKHAGSKVILEYIKKEQPKCVFCGHIHEAKGEAKIGNSHIFNLGEAGIKILEI